MLASTLVWSVLSWSLMNSHLQLGCTQHEGMCPESVQSDEAGFVCIVHTFKCTATNAPKDVRIKRNHCDFGSLIPLSSNPIYYYSSH